jgi:sulfatase modifying factor 1
MRQAWWAICLMAASCGHNQSGGAATDAAVDGAIGTTVDAADAGGSPAVPNCMGLPMTCGARGNDSCCQAAPITGGTFYRSYDAVGFTDMGFPAKVSDFTLDKYEVTVGRFRAFVNAGFGTQANPPAAGGGIHPRLAGSGWDSAWNSLLATNTTALVKAIKCGAPYQTWTDAPSENDNKPMSCATWQEAMAFCIWDGGYLPTEAEWNYAASGGSEQRVYPWSNPASSSTIDCAYANYYVNSPDGTFCVTAVTGAANRVGSESPMGDGRWGHSDLVGNAWEWTLDWYALAYSLPCDDCANLSPATFRVTRGGSSLDDAPFVHAASRGNLTPTDRSNVVGFRCAR